jgi:pSer/pThr/pTyr-binding forkhead associated (FHA) protein
MDNVYQTAEGEGSAPPPAAHASGGRKAFDVIPLRLTLQTSGRSIDVTQPEVVIGRHTEADLRLPLPDVSRRHCRLVYAEGRWQVFDLDSLNGVYVNGYRVKQAYLDEDDTLRVGGFVFDVHVRSEGRPDVLQLPPGGSREAGRPTTVENGEHRRAG